MFTTSHRRVRSRYFKAQRIVLYKQRHIPEFAILLRPKMLDYVYRENLTASRRSAFKPRFLLLLLFFFFLLLTSQTQHGNEDAKNHSSFSLTRFRAVSQCLPAQTRRYRPPLVGAHAKKVRTSSVRGVKYTTAVEQEFRCLLYLVKHVRHRVGVHALAVRHIMFSSGEK